MKTIIILFITLFSGPYVISQEFKTHFFAVNQNGADTITLGFDNAATIWINRHFRMGATTYLTTK